MKGKPITLELAETSVLCDILLAFEKARQIATNGTAEEAGKMLECALTRQADAGTFCFLYGSQDGEEAKTFLEDVKQKELFIQPLTDLINAIKQGNPMAGEIAKLDDKQRAVIKRLVIAQFTHQFLVALKFDSSATFSVEDVKDEVKVQPFYWGMLEILNNGEIYEEVPLLIIVILALLKKGNATDGFLKTVRQADDEATPSELNGGASSAKVVENVLAVIPSKFIITNSKIDNKLIEIAALHELVAIENGSPKTVRQPLDVGHKKGTARITVDYNDPNIVPTWGYRTLSEYDQAVLNAIFTMYETLPADKKIFTAAQIYKALDGGRDARGISRTALAPTVESIEKLRVRLIKIDLSEEVKNRYPELKNKEFIYAEESYLAPLSKVEVIINGQKAEGYKFISEPLLYAYAKGTKQLISVNIDTIRTKHIIDNTQENNVLKQYLLRNIGLVRNKGAVVADMQAEGYILYSSIMQKLGYGEGYTGIEKQRVRNKVNKLLQHFVDRGEIDGFMEEKGGRGGRAIEKIKLLVPVNKKVKPKKKRKS